MVSHPSETRRKTPAVSASAKQAQPLFARYASAAPKKTSP
jgi:hypothetical protein